MKIKHVCVSDIDGGAARAAYRLHLGLTQAGQDSTMLVGKKHSNDPRVVRFDPRPDAVSRFKRRARRAWLEQALRYHTGRAEQGFDLFSDDRSRFGAEVAEQCRDAEIINLHWVAGFVDWREFFSAIPKRAGVVWTLHDMGPFTGGCHYDNGCGRFREQCGQCPLLKKRNDHDFSLQVWTRKKTALEALDPARVRFAADSHWLADEARRSSLFGRFDVRAIHYGLDAEAFAPRDRAHAREVLGIPAEKKVLLFGAYSVNDRRKGYPELVEALAKLQTPDVVLVTIGAGKIPAQASHPTIHLGSIGNDRVLSMIYSAADVFVLPSLQEAFGQTALESIACGTPVAAFDAGGIPDIVRPEQTGLLARVGDSTGLAVAIDRLLGAPALRAEMSRVGREIVLREFTLATQAENYVRLYESLLSGKSL